MSKKSKIQLKAEKRLTELEELLTTITLTTEKWQDEFILVENQIILLKELLTYDQD